MNKITLSALTVAGLALAFILGKNHVGALPLSDRYALGALAFGLAVVVAGSFGQSAARAAIVALVAGLVVGVFLANDVAPFMSLSYVAFAGFLARPAGWPDVRTAAYAGLASLPVLFALIAAPTFMQGLTLGLVAGAIGAAVIWYDDEIRGRVRRVQFNGLRHMWTENTFPRTDVIETETGRAARVRWGESYSLLYKGLRYSSYAVAVVGAAVLAIDAYAGSPDNGQGVFLLVLAAGLFVGAWLLPSKFTYRALAFDTQGAVRFETSFGRTANAGNTLAGGLAAIRSVESALWLDWNPQPEALRLRHAHHFQTFFLTDEGDKVVISDNHAGREFHIKLVATLQKVMETVRQVGREHAAAQPATAMENPFDN